MLSSAGRIVKSNASHPDGEHKDRFILLGLKMDELMSTTAFQKIANDIHGVYKDISLEDLRTAAQ